MAANEPLEPKDLTPAEAAATVNAYRVLADAIDNDQE